MYGTMRECGARVNGVAAKRPDFLLSGLGSSIWRRCGLPLAMTPRRFAEAAVTLHNHHRLPMSLGVSTRRDRVRTR